jgi:predicted TIM-barrel fold metal-dependent hydrolase
MTDPIYDTHAHVFSSDIARYPVTPGTIRQTPEQVIERIKADPLPGEKLLSLFDEAGVTGGAAVQYSAVYKTDNTYLLDAASESAGRLAAVVILNARDAETPAKLRDFVETRGTTGLRLSGPIADDGSMDWLDGPDALRTWEEANRLHLAMVVMWLQDVPDPRGFARLVALHDLFPNVRIAVDHFGWANAATLTPQHLTMVDRPRLFFKLTSINFRVFGQAGIDAARFLRDAVDVYGAERIMWGSDVGNTRLPYTQMADDARRCAGLLNDAERRAFLHDSGHALFAARPEGL